ncbi:RING-H2 finger protein ATL18-like [Rutidosis leptorrhynchoides]|uniref:RING-H2 finger protein ATL18-like n=1 Tax=Rutidosis leptorrhynchoides TaxID=125765 RepID=UPI003A9922CE
MKQYWICDGNATVLFYVCVLLLLFRSRRDIFRILKIFMHDVFQEDHIRDATLHDLDLPVIKFEDLQNRRGDRSFDDVCLVCFMEYEKDDGVTQLSRCGHVYHTNCVAKLLNEAMVERWRPDTYTFHFPIGLKEIFRCAFAHFKDIT